MTADIIRIQQAVNPVLPDDILVYATRMFLPDEPGVDLNGMILQALSELRDTDRRVKWHGVSPDRAKWQAADPVYIAHYTMMFMHPQLGGMQKHHDWHGRLIRLVSEREKRFIDCREKASHDAG